MANAPIETKPMLPLEILLPLLGSLIRFTRWGGSKDGRLPSPAASHVRATNKKISPPEEWNDEGSQPLFQQPAKGGIPNAINGNAPIQKTLVRLAQGLTTELRGGIRSVTLRIMVLLCETLCYSDTSAVFY